MKSAPKKSAKSLLLLALVVLIAITTISISAAPQDRIVAPVAAEKLQSYIVVMEAEPLVAYEGDVRTFRATKPDKGKKFNLNSAAARRYEAYLQRNQDKVLRDAGVSKDSVANYYSTALNGFSAIITAEQANQVAKQEGVAFIVRDQWRNR